MTWESIIGGALQGISQFIQNLIEIIGGSFTPAASEGVIALFAIGFLIRLLEGGRPKLPRLRREDEEEEWVMVRRKK